ncbi:MAG: tetratricopeptide repeat protein, partial [Acidobacteriaceae bacterium]|nr:tetratricopeptide repeat protein [Acidobacteriaceae bacterium]
MTAYQNNLRTTVGVLVVLAFAFALTAYLTAAYKREREALGRAHNIEGETLTRETRFDDAAEEYQKALFFSPDRNEYHIGLVSALIRAGRFDEAQQHLQELILRNPSDGYTSLLLARIAKNRGNAKEAITYYRRAVCDWPQTNIPERRQARWELIGLLEQSSSQRPELVSQLMQIYAAGPAPAEAVTVGFLLLKYDAASEAMRVFYDVLREHPNDASA